MYFALNDRKAVFCWLMNGERERYKDLPTEEELDEDLIFLSYAAQEGIPFEHVFDGLKLDVDPYGFDKYFENRTEQQYYMLAGLLYENAPSDDLEFESERLISSMFYYQNRFVEDPEVKMDTEGYEAVIDMEVGGLADFLTSVHAEYLDEAKTELGNGRLFLSTVSKLALFSKIEKIADRAAEIFDEGMAA